MVAVVSYYSSAGKHVSISFFSQHHQLSASSSASWSPWSRIIHRPASMSAYPSSVSIISCQHHHRHHRRRGPRITHGSANISSYPSSVSIVSCQHDHRHHRRRGLVLLIGRQACQHTLLQSASSAVSIIIGIIVAVVSYYSSAGKHVSIPFCSQHHQLSASSSA